MTRMEKYHNYRQEIAQSAILGQSIVDSDKTLAKYKKKIDEINPVILTMGANESLNIVKGVTDISLEQKQIPNEISNLFSTLDKARSISNKENISLLLFNMSNNSILGKNDNVKEEWLKTNTDYASIMQYKKDLNFDPENIKKILEQKYEDFISINEVDKFEHLSQISLTDQKRWSSYTFAISIAMAIIFLLLSFGLLIFKMVK